MAPPTAAADAMAVLPALASDAASPALTSPSDTVRSSSKAGADSELDDKRSLDSCKGELDSLPQGVEADGSYNPAVVGHPWRVKGPAIFCVLLLTCACVGQWACEPSD